MDDDQQFCLRWNNHQSTLVSQFDTLLENEAHVDCTLAAEGKYLKAHKVVLSACSPYFETLLREHYDKHPVFILKDVKYQELRVMVEYMYRGEVNIGQDQLGAVLKAAESLQIKGLSDGKAGSEKKLLTPLTSKGTGPTAMKQVVKRTQSPLVFDGDVLAMATPAGSVSLSSPTPRKRKKTRRQSQGESLIDNNDTQSNTSSSNSQSTNANIKTAPSTISAEVPNDTFERLTYIAPSSDHIINNTVAVERIEIPKAELSSEIILEPKSEYLDEYPDDCDVQDLTLDDDEIDQLEAGPSHAEDSSQGFQFPQYDDRTQDEVFNAAREAAAGHGDLQQDSVYANKHISATQDLQKQSDPLEPATDYVIIVSPSTSHSGRHFTRSISATPHASLELEDSQVDVNTDDIVEPIARDFWSYEETLALIQWYIANQEKFQTTKNKKRMWELMSDELSSKGIIKKPKACLNKWKNLLRTYKIVKDNVGKTGREGGGHTRFAYYNIMDECLGNKQSTSCNHAISVGAKASNTLQDLVESAKTPDPLQDTDDLESNDNDNK